MFAVSFRIGSWATSSHHIWERFTLTEWAQV